MSDQHDAGPLPELTPEQESEVRRLLADARHDEPVPAEVADRLETVLAELSRDDPGAPGVAPVIDLAARRRRRNAAAVLAGAAAVIVAGFAMGQVIDVGGSNDDSAGSAAQEARTSAGSGDAPKSGLASSQSPEAGTPSAAATAEAVPVPEAPPTLVLSSGNLKSDLTAQLRRGPSQTVDGGAHDFSVAGCTPPAPPSKYGLGDLFPALFDGQPAVVALRPPADGKREADVLACTTAVTLASVTLPQP
jgi:hypothetical protein